MIQEIFAFQSESEYKKLEQEIKDLKVFLKDATRSKDLFRAYSCTSYASQILDRIESCFKKIEKIKGGEINQF